MEPKKYPFIHSMNQKIATTRLGSWFYARTLHHFDRAFLLLSGGRTTMSSLLAGLPVAWVTATGAKSGRPRTVPLVYVPIDPNAHSIALIASNYGQRHNPAWYYNLKANPRVTCRLKDGTREYLARETSGEEYDRIWEHAKSIYLGYSLYKQRASHRNIRIMALTPV